MKVKRKVAGLPEATGVYIFKGPGGEILYIGKAKSLKKRVSSYFTRRLDSKTQALVSKIKDVEYRLVSSESQAEILESALIKDHQPQYNIDLKDDKSFPWIRITAEKFPIVSVYRRKVRLKGDKSCYYGPYTDAKSLREAVKVIRRVFGFRSCKAMPKKACLYFRLQLCPAPCIGNISARRYRETISQIKMFLESRYEELISRLSEKMKECAARKDFEEAAKIRDQIQALGVVSQGASPGAYLNELQDLAGLLKLGARPLRIEAFDISNISGKEATGSMVSFFRGRADKNNYRRFRIKTVGGIDDYSMIREIIRRRYSRLKQEDAKFPDLIIIDGGKGHLSAAYQELDKLGLTIPMISIAKEKENIYSLDRDSPVRLKESSLALNLIRRIRDEAHRFAVKYHHLLRRKKIIR